MKVKEILRLLEEDGWYLARTKGSHRQLKHRNKSAQLPFPENRASIYHRGTLHSILKQAGLKKERP
jgi:predicted RNA binding protein YcfA (HicA-like mRNA interferase family)